MLPLLIKPPLLGIGLKVLGDTLMDKKLTCATAESCTAGLLAASMTSIPGSSAWFLGGVIAYANEVKMAQLNVPEQILLEHGAVSGECVMHMASGLCTNLSADVGVSISGIAGPDGGTELKPVGTVWIGFCVLGVTSARLFHFQGSREHVRMQSVVRAVQGLIERL